jgi:hypothetical protein
MQNMPDSIKAQKMQKAEDYARAATKIQTGLIAQEVEKTAKDLGYNFDGVKAPQNPTDHYRIAYSEFVMPLIKAVQELSKINDNKDAKIDDLQKQLDAQQKEIDEMKAMMQQCRPCGNASTSVAAGSGYNATVTDIGALEQNVPNPFTNATTIGYSLPQRFSSAQIVITDKNGRSLKQVTISGSGKGKINIDASTLASGAYNYALYVDGKFIASKQMVLAK